VPFGRYDNPTLCDAPRLRAASHALKKTTFFVGDFERTVRSAEAGDLVYFDPPYVPVSATSNFTSYTKEKFGPGEQERLRDVALRLKKLGVHVALSNADVPFVRKLYKGSAFKIHSVSARRNINSKGGSRGTVGEVIIT
jgi:DNA adenine methylase